MDKMVVVDYLDKVFPSFENLGNFCKEIHDFCEATGIVAIFHRPSPDLQNTKVETGFQNGTFNVIFSKGKDYPVYIYPIKNRP